MQWLTMSAPQSSHRPTSRVSSVLVPTPSVLATSRGDFSLERAETSNTPPNEPWPATTRSSWVVLTAWARRLWAARPASKLTPASA